MDSLAIGILAHVRYGAAVVDVVAVGGDCEVYKHYALFVPADAYAPPYRHVESGMQVFVAELFARQGDGDCGGAHWLRQGVRTAGDLPEGTHG